MACAAMVDARCFARRPHPRGTAGGHHVHGHPPIRQSLARPPGPPCRGGPARQGDHLGRWGAGARAILPPGGPLAFERRGEARRDDGRPDTIAGHGTGRQGCRDRRVRPRGAFVMGIGWEQLRAVSASTPRDAPWKASRSTALVPLRSDGPRLEPSAPPWQQGGAHVWEDL